MQKMNYSHVCQEVPTCLAKTSMTRSGAGTTRPLVQSSCLAGYGGQEFTVLGNEADLPTYLRFCEDQLQSMLPLESWRSPNHGVVLGNVISWISKSVSSAAKVV